MKFIYKSYEVHRVCLELNDKLQDGAKAKTTNIQNYLHEEGEWPQQSKAKEKTITYLPGYQNRRKLMKIIWQPTPTTSKLWMYKSYVLISLVTNSVAGWEAREMSELLVSSQDYIADILL